MDYRLEQKAPNLWIGRFQAMASPCEVWLETDQLTATTLVHWAQGEAKRLETKYNRFDPQSYLSQINAQAGVVQSVDAETSALLDLANQAWCLSDGLFDISVMPLMALWRFDGHSPPPSTQAIEQAQKHCGWSSISWQAPELLLPAGFALDLGGLVKEYAVDRVALGLAERLPLGGILVNFGGDLSAPHARIDQRPWQVKLEAVNQGDNGPKIELFQGAITTSGHTKRFVVDKQGRKWGHVVHPKTGYPVMKGPATVSVIGSTATQAGILSTLAMLQGKRAEKFLRKQAVEFYCQWD